MLDRPRRHHISSAIVVTHPRRADAIASILAGIENVEVHASQHGKIVIVIEGRSAGELGETLVGISAMDGVIAAHMVFEQVLDEQEE